MEGLDRLTEGEVEKDISLVRFVLEVMEGGTPDR